VAEIPGWVPEAVFYQIFPDRFANGDPSNDPPNLQPWGSPPTIWGFQGGDLLGIVQQLDYLADLGVNAIYLNPIFQATSNHRYNTTDYYRIDPKLGTLEDFRRLLTQAHRRGMKIILDGVFNHCGRGFFAFHDLLENQEHSPYRDWFHVKSFPVRAYGSGKAETYLGWWEHKELPKFNTANPQVRRYLLAVARHWIEQGADGWRLDVPNEIDDDDFWGEFRETVKRANPEAYLVGEIWSPDPRWVGGRHFDGLLHYPLRQALIEYLRGEGEGEGETLAEKVEGLLRIYPPEHRTGHYITLGSHDTPRLRTELGSNLAKVRLALLAQFTHPGAPGIYYGDEIGLEGGKDPGCRGAFPWDRQTWQRELREHVQRLIGLRRQHPQLRRGELRHVRLGAKGRVAAWSLQMEGAPTVAVLLNAGRSRAALSLPGGDLGWADGTPVREALSGRQHTVEHGQLGLALPAQEGALLIPDLPYTPDV
jgi:glycosidase